MLCAKCQKNEATVHVTTVVGDEQETVDFCRDCAPASFALDAEKAQANARSIMGKHCDFCGAAYSYSRQVLAGYGEKHFCCECDTELMSIAIELIEAERPGLLRRIKEVGSKFLSTDPAFCRKSIQLLSERRRQDGGVKRS